MGRPSNYSPEFRADAVALVLDSTPPATDHAGTAPIVTLSSLAAATVLDTGTSDPQYLL
jgi:transposase-like protein